MLRCGSCAYIPTFVPYFDRAPTMLVGCHLSQGLWFMVATINKQFNLYHTYAGASIYQGLFELMAEFKLMQNTYPKHVICFSKNPIPDDVNFVVGHIEAE